VGVVNQVAGRACLANNLIEKGNVLVRFSKQNKRRRSENASEIVERHVQRDRRMKHPGMRYNAQKLVDARPWDRLGTGPLGEAFEQSDRGSVMAIRVHFGVDQDIRVDCLHASPAVHQVKEGFAVQEIDSRQFSGFPAVQSQLVRAGRGSCHCLAKEVVGDGLKCAPLLGGSLLQSAEQPVVNRQCGSLHTQKHTRRASRCQRPRRIDDFRLAIDDCLKLALPKALLSTPNRQSTIVNTEYGEQPS
jgi:hypothetical protein